ncbi:MAG TPA: GDSL-type esterase/lipase family protein [Corynebacterium sp.]|nr:GDSL-type esterase/lipase family protein [Corynebacterium sp.]
MISRAKRTATPAAALLAAATLLISTFLAPAPAEAQTGNVVTFGDSFTASPDQIKNQISHLSSGSSNLAGSSLDDYPRRGGCLQSPDNWPRLLAERTGRQVDDWSCTAETSHSVLSRLDAAIGAGDIHAGTHAVILNIGGNDFGPVAVAEGVPFLDVPVISERFTGHMHTAAAKIRAAAPQARIVLAGYPEITNGSGLCLLNIIPQVPLGIPVPGAYGEGVLQEMQRNAAEATGMIFVDNYAQTTGHNTCSPNDSRRYVAAMIDTTSPVYTMSLHPTVLGHSVLADNNATAL